MIPRIEVTGGARPQLTDVGYRGRSGSGCVNEIVMSELGMSPNASAEVNTEAFQRAADEVTQRGIGQIILDGGVDYRLNPLTISGVNNLKIRATGPGTRLVGNNMGTASRALIKIAGSELPATTMTASAAKGATTITVAEPEKLAVNGFIRLQSSGEYLHGVTGVSGFGRVNKSGIYPVEQISGQTITLAYPLETSYSVGDGITVSVTPIAYGQGVTVEGIEAINDAPDYDSLTNGNGPSCWLFEYMQDVRVRDCNGYQWQNAFGRARRCWNVDIFGGSMWGRFGTRPDDCYYGWVNDGSYHMFVRYLYGRWMRRVADSTSTDMARHYVQHHLTAEYCNGSGFGSHHCQDYLAHDCKSYYTTIGGIFRGIDGRIHDCEMDGFFQIGTNIGTVSEEPNHGIITLDGLRTGGQNSNSIRAVGSYEELNILNSVLNNATAYAILHQGRRRGRTMIKGNVIQMLAGRSSSNHAIYLQNLTDALKSDSPISIEGNDVFNLNGGLVALIEANTGATVSDYVSARNNNAFGAASPAVVLSGTFGSNVSI